MGNGKDLYGISNNIKMREAMKLLGSQFGIKDKNSFVQILLMGAAADGNGCAFSSLFGRSRAA